MAIKLYKLYTICSREASHFQYDKLPMRLKDANCRYILKESATDGIQFCILDGN